MESMSEVKTLADEILATGKSINMLINNAGASPVSSLMAINCCWLV